MVTALVVVFVVAYAAIALEHPLKVNKSASALIGAGLLWTLFALATGAHHLVGEQLRDSLATTAGIVFFLMGAMTIVEVVDAHNGFEVITSPHQDHQPLLADVAGRLRHVLPQRRAGQPDDHHRDDLADEEAARQARRPPLLRRHDRHRRQRRRRLVADRRRDDHDALDRRPDHDAQHHEVGLSRLRRQPGRAAGDHQLPAPGTDGDPARGDESGDTLTPAPPSSAT